MTQDKGSARAFIGVIDDDLSVREALDGILQSVGLEAMTFSSTHQFLEHAAFEDYGCLVLDVRMPGKSGLDLQEELSRRNISTPVIILTGHADVPMAVRAMKAGASGFLTKPVRAQDLLDAVEEAVAKGEGIRGEARITAELTSLFDTLTKREREVFEQVAAGLINKQIGAELGLSEATVKLHRGIVMRKMQAASLADLVRMADRLGRRPKVG
jgi:FixJ family two-component response regulator